MKHRDEQDKVWSPQMQVIHNLLHDLNQACILNMPIDLTQPFHRNQAQNRDPGVGDRCVDNISLLPCHWSWLARCPHLVFSEDWTTLFALQDNFHGFGGEFCVWHRLRVV